MKCDESNRVYWFQTRFLSLVICRLFLTQRSSFNDVSATKVFSPPPVKLEGTIGLHSVRLSVRLSVSLSICHTRFLDFSSLYVHISGWKLVASFHMNSYRSSSTFVKFDLLFSAPEPKAQVHYCDHTLSVVRRPSVRPSSVRPSLTFTFSTSPLKPLNRIQRNLSASKISMSSTKFVFLRLIGKTRWPPWALIGWDTFDFFS